MKARQMRKDTINAVEISFNNYLHQRGFTGGLNMNKTEQELQLEVCHIQAYRMATKLPPCCDCRELVEVYICPA